MDDWGNAADLQEQKAKYGGGGRTFAGLSNQAATRVPISPINVNCTDGSGEGTDDKPTSPADASFLNKILHSKLVELKSDSIEIQRKNPNSPLFAVKAFSELPLKKQLLEGVYNMGFRLPSKIQETALPALLSDPPQNMIAQSQSGTGKTAAFALTMLSRVNPDDPFPQALCLSPTYELALQTGKVVEKMGQNLHDVKLAYAVRGANVNRGRQLTEQIIIGTPGTVLDWIQKFRCLDLSRLKVFVLDEADVMISQQGHMDQSIRIHRNLNPQCQMLLFSATYDENVMDFAEKLIKDPIVIRLRREEETLDNIKQYYVECSNVQSKYAALNNIYGVLTIGQAVIFCHTRRAAADLVAVMSNAGHSVGLLSGELTIEQRAAVIERFKMGKEKVLITTNVSARGIDVEQVNIVINFDLPLTVDFRPDFETYLHRIGRTGRFGKAGIAINLIDGQRSYAVMKAIEEHFKTTVHKLDVYDVDELLRINR